MIELSTCYAWRRCVSAYLNRSVHGPPFVEPLSIGLTSSPYRYSTVLPLF